MASKLFEESMILDIIGSLLEVTVSFGQIMFCEVSDEALCSFIEVFRELYVGFQDLSEDLHGVFGLERAVANHDLIDEDSKAPPVNSFSVTFVLKDLWSKVFRSATQSVSAFAWLDKLDKSKVS